MAAIVIGGNTKATWLGGHRRLADAVGFPGDTAQAGTPAGTAVDRRVRCLPDAR
jgi:hypothetical protein